MPGSPKKRARRIETLAAAVNAKPPGDYTGDRAAPRARTMTKPPSMTDEQLDGILSALAAGVTLSAACASVRFPSSTLYDWMKADPEFGRLIDDAREGWAAQHARYIAESTDWKARSWLLGVRLPKEYAPTSKLAGHDGGALLADAELLELARRALGVAPPDGDAGED